MKIEFNKFFRITFIIVGIGMMLSVMSWTLFFGFLFYLLGTARVELTDL